MKPLQASFSGALSAAFVCWVGHACLGSISWCFACSNVILITGLRSSALQTGLHLPSRIPAWEMPLTLLSRRRRESFQWFVFPHWECVRVSVTERLRFQNALMDGSGGLFTSSPRGVRTMFTNGPELGFPSQLTHIDSQSHHLMSAIHLKERTRSGGQRLKPLLRRSCKENPLAGGTPTQCADRGHESSVPS